MNNPYLPTLPSGTVVASYKKYEDAQAAVDLLADSGFPVQTTAIVGSDLSMVERITGRLTLGRVALSSALNGIWLGVFMGAFYGIFNPGTALSTIMPVGVMMGLLFGLLTGVIPYLLSGGKRDFTSAKQVVAARYDVLASEQVARARELLARTRGFMAPAGGLLAMPAQSPAAFGGDAVVSDAAVAAPAPSAPSEPLAPTPFGSRPDEQPRFGVRVDPATGQPIVPGAKPAAEQAAGGAAQVTAQPQPDQPAQPPAPRGEEFDPLLPRK